MVYPNAKRRNKPCIQSPKHFIIPGDQRIKLNFDGASKVNPGQAGLGGIFRDSRGNTRWVYAEWGGEMMNNKAELWAVHQGLRVAIRNDYMNLEIEGDSQIMIEMLRKLRDGRSWDRVTNSSRTTGIIQDIEGLVNKIEYKIINQVLRSGNHAVIY